MGQDNQVSIGANPWPTILWTGKFALGLYMAGMLVVWLNSQGAPTDDILGLGTYVLLWGVLAVVLFAIFLHVIIRISAIHVTPDQINGRDYWGFRVRIPSDSISAIGVKRYLGIRHLVLSSDEAAQQICLVMLGISPADHADELSDMLGSEHKLTRWFATYADATTP